MKYWQWQFGGPPCPQMISRRRDVRVEPAKPLTLVIPAANGRATVKDISRRGVCLSADAAFALGSIHDVTIALGLMTVRRRGRTIHCHRHPTDGWIMGLEFLDDPVRPGDDSIDDLMDEVTAGAVTFR